MERLLDALTGKGSSEATREKLPPALRRRQPRNEPRSRSRCRRRRRCRSTSPAWAAGDDQPDRDDGQGDGRAAGQAPQAQGAATRSQRLVEEEADKRVDQDDINRVALADAEANGIVFLDEIDKIAVSDVRGGSVSREGVQRDLLPLIEGTTVATKYGPLKTDHILFIASGAFHIAKPADLLPELQGRLPIRVELKALTQEDFVRILSQTRASLTAAIPGAARHRGRHHQLRR